MCFPCLPTQQSVFSLGLSTGCACFGPIILSVRGSIAVALDPGRILADLPAVTTVPAQRHVPRPQRRYVVAPSARPHVQ